MHKIQTDHTQSHIIFGDEDLHVEITGYHVFVISSKQRVTINLFVTQAVTADVQFYCADNVDLVVRLIILFPATADINISVMMCGNDSNVTILGMCALHEQQLVIIKTRQVHCGKRCNSKLVLQGLITGAARLTYDGTIRIEKDACGTYALQNNKNILLSSTAAAVSIPNIEVLNHDVQCYHGAAIGRFDGTQMHYMQSRGLDELMIRKLLVQALFADVLQGYGKRELILQTVYKKI